MIKSAAEATEVEESFRSAVERNSHPVEQIDDRRRRLAHIFHGRLIGEEVAAIDCVVEVLPGTISLAFKVLGSVDAALSANGVRALYRDDREQINIAAAFSDLDSG